MASITQPTLDLAKCFKGEQQLITWETAYSALCDPATAAKSQPLRDFLTADENVAILSTPWTPFPPPSPQEKSKFESATAPISVSPAHNEHYNLDEIKDDSLWLSKVTQISEYAALRLAVQEWQTRPTVQLLDGLTEEEVLSVKEAAGLNNLRVSAFIPNSSILGNPTASGEQSTPQFDSSDQRKIRLIGIYFSTCAAVLRVSQMLVSWGAAGDMRTTQPNYPPDYRVAADHFQQLGQEIAAKQAEGGASPSDAPALDRCIDAVSQKLEALGQGCTWDLPDSIQDHVVNRWTVGHTTQLVHILHLALFHANHQTKGLLPAKTVYTWFGVVVNLGFFRDFPFPVMYDEQSPLLPPIQILTSMVSVAILKPKLVFEDLASGACNEWNPTCYVLDGNLLEQLTEVLNDATGVVTPGLPAVFVWTAIVWRLRFHVHVLEEERDRLLESAPDGRLDLPAPSKLEEALHSLARVESTEIPMSAQMAAKCVTLGVLPAMKGILDAGMQGFGASVDQVSRDMFRLLYSQVIRYTMESNAIDFSTDGLVDLAHQILVGERTSHNWSKNDTPRYTDPIVTYFREDTYLKSYLLESAHVYYPYEVEPLLLFSSALIRGEGPKDDGESTAYDELVSMRSVTQRLPVDFKDYRLEQEDTNENRVALMVDLPQFIKSNNSTFLNRSTPAPPPQPLMTLEANTQGVILDVSEYPYVARWVYNHSALDYFYHLLSTYVVGSTKVVYATQRPASTAEAAKIIELFADIMHSSLQASKARGTGSSCSADVLAALSIGREHSPDTISIVLSIFEEQLLRQYQDPANELLLELLVACTHFVQALIAVAPSRVWPWIARSRLLGSDGNGGSLASILIGTEMVLGRYKFLIGCIHLFGALVDDAVERSVYRQTTSKNRGSALALLNAPVASQSGTSEKSMSNTLLTFGRTLASIYETSLGWKYNDPADRLHINIGICEAFTNVLHLAYSIDDAPELTQKLTKIIGPTAEYITELYLTKSTNDLPTNPLLSSLLSGTDLIRDTTLTSRTSLLKRQTQSTLRFSEVLVRVAMLLDKPWTHLEQQLFKATPLLARLYVTSEVWKYPVVTLLETLVRGAVRVVEGELQKQEGTPKKRDYTEPPSLLGHLGPRTAKNFMTVLSQLDEPLKIVDIQRSVWNLLTAVVSCKQQWFSLYLLTGNTPRETMRSKSKPATQSPRSKSLLSRALDALSRLDPEVQDPPWSLWTAMLEFITSAQNHWSWAMGDLRGRTEFIDQLLKFLKWISNQPQPQELAAFGLRSHENRFASLAANILAMYLHSARQAGDNQAFKKIVDNNGVKYFQEEALKLPSYNVALHSNLKRNIEQNFPGVVLDNFKRTTLFATTYGPDFFYDIHLASTLLEHDTKWSGPRAGRGFKAEVERANYNLSLVDSQLKLLHSWELLSLELSHFVAKPHPNEQRINEILIKVVKGCMHANAESNLPEALFGQLMAVRADLAYALLKRLVENKVKSDAARELLGPVWAAVRACTSDFDNVFSSERVDYYRSLLRILYLTLAFYSMVDAKEASFRSSFRGTLAKKGDETPISLELLEILSDTVAKGFRSLASQLHADPSSVLPSDFALLTALLQRIIAIPEMATSHTQIALLFANSNTLRYATSLFSWSDKLTLDTTGTGTPDDPVYGELSLLFILTLSSIRPLAETMAVEGVLAQLNNANLMNYFRRARGMGPFDAPPRVHAIWAKGILPLCLNLLVAVGPPIAGEIASFLNAYPEQLQRSSNALNSRYATRITFNLAAETHSLALISTIIEGVRTQGASVGVQPGDVQPLDWDRENVREDIEGWASNWGVLAERVVGDGTKAYEDKVVAEVEAAGVCLGLGSEKNTNRRS